MKSPLKNKLAKNEQVIGAFVNFYAPAIVEILGYSGYDFIVIDDEHGTFSASEMENLIRTAELVDVVPIVRVSYDESSIQRALDRGAKGIHVPMVNSKHDVLDVIKKSKFPPIGERGVSYSIRPTHFGKYKGEQYLKDCNKKTMICAHIETLEAANHFEDIVNTEGVDIAFIGSTDLSVNMGYSESGANHPEVQKVISNLYEKGREHGIKIGTVASSSSGVKKAFEDGAQYVCVSINSVMVASFERIVQERHS